MYQPTFARAATDYESYALPQFKAARRLVERVLAKIKPDSIRSLVDIGCGTAFASQALLQSFSDQGTPYPAECLLLDREATMLEVALQNLRVFSQLNPQCMLVDAFDQRWAAAQKRSDQSLGNRLVLSSYLLQWSLDPLEALIGVWINHLAKNDVLAISFPDARSFNWLRMSLIAVGLDDRTLKLFDSEVILGESALDQLSQYYEIISWGHDDDSISIKQPLDYLRHFSRIGSTTASQRYSPREVRMILKGLYLLAEDGYPCKLDYYSSWLLLKRR